VLTIALIAVSIGLDNFAASIAIGLAGIDRRLRLRIAVVFGLFEAGMPLVGLLAGRGLAHTLGGSAHILGGGLLIATGAHAIVATLRSDDDDDMLQGVLAGPPLAGPSPAGSPPAGGSAAGSPPAGGSPAGSPPPGPPLARLLVLGTALSIDNLIVGFALGTDHAPLILSVVTIGVVSVGLSLVGLELGARLGARVDRYGELIGGAVLVGVGIAVLTRLI
jgi:putative Mn2+ efflux pump MntP